MSLRYWYRKAAKERICFLCDQVIQRNIALYQGEPVHYGCLQKALVKKYKCMGCFAVLNTLETVKANVAGREERHCGYCGSPVQPLYTYQPPIINIIPHREVST